MNEQPPPSVAVWDRLSRAAHWLLVLAVATAWLTRHRAGPWHEWLGYAALIVAGVRIAWGFRGPPHARFAEFVRPPVATWRYAHDVLRRRDQRFLGHNPLGGAMIIALLAVVVLVGATGWLYTTDAFWGIAWVGDLHDGLSNLLLVLIALHVGGVLAASHRHRENLIAAMFTGRKRT